MQLQVNLLHLVSHQNLLTYETAPDADFIVSLSTGKKVRLQELRYTLGSPLLCNLIIPGVSHLLLISFAGYI
jgi:hypothetical protein